MSDSSLNRFHLGHEKGHKTDPDYEQTYGEKLPPLRAFGNLSYIQFIDLITYVWEKAHPEVKIIPYAGRDKYDAENGYIVYSLETKKPSDDNLKPRHRQDTVKTDDGDFEARVFTQSFTHLVEFTAVHHDPRTSEQILEAFEDFMIVTTPEIKQAGAEELVYNRRISDRDMSRFGDDVTAKSVMYLVVLQKHIIIKPEILESIRIDVRTFRSTSPPALGDILYFDVIKDS